MSLQAEIQNDPLNRGYAAHIPHAPGLIVNMLNEYIYMAPKQKFVNARGVLASLGLAGATILDKLEAATGTNSAVKWAMKFMTLDGIDVGNTVTRQVLDSLVGTVLTQQEVDMLKDLALQPASRAEVLGLGTVEESQVRSAIGV